MASLTDDNEADGSLDKRNIWLIGAGYTRYDFERESNEKQDL